MQLSVIWNVHVRTLEWYVIDMYLSHVFLKPKCGITRSYVTRYVRPHLTHENPYWTSCTYSRAIRSNQRRQNMFFSPKYCQNTHFTMGHCHQFNFQFLKYILGRLSHRRVYTCPGTLWHSAINIDMSPSHALRDSLKDISKSIYRYISLVLDISRNGLRYIPN